MSQLRCSVALAACITLAGAAPAQPSPEVALARSLDRDLFEGAARPLSPSQEPAHTPVRSIHLRGDRLAKLAPGAIFTLTPEPDITLLCVVDRAERRAAHHATVVAHAEGLEGSQIIFVTEGDATAMLLAVPTRALLYRLQFAGGGDYEVRRHDSARALNCNSMEYPAEPPRILEPGDDDYTPPYGGRSGGGCNADAPVLDIMMLYTQQATAAAGGHNAIRAEAALAVEAANTCYQNSNATARMRLVRCTEVGYVESGDDTTDLARLTDPADGFLDFVPAMRDEENADIVSLMVALGDGQGNCNAGYGRAYNVVNWETCAADLVLAHESAHNIGCSHDRATGGCTPSYTYGWGYKLEPGDGHTYRTVMAYRPGIRIFNFSNPNITFMGEPTGVPIGDPQEAYNARVITLRAPTLEGFELTRFDIYVDMGWNGAEAGTYLFPYDSIPEGVNAIQVPSPGAAELPNLYVRGESDYTGTITKAMTITPCGGPARIGAP